MSLLDEVKLYFRNNYGELVEWLRVVNFEDDRRRITEERVSSVLTYIGRTFKQDAEDTDPVWQVSRVTREGLATCTRLAANGTYDQKFSDRATLFPECPFANALSVSFDGVNDFLNGGNIFNFDNATAWTFSFWVKPNNLTAQRCFYAKTTEDANVYGIGIYHDASGHPFIQMRAAGQLRSYTGNLTFTAGHWQHFVVTYDGSQNINGLRVYIDNTVDVVPGSGIITSTLLYSQSAYFGKRSSAFYYAGNMDEISVWGIALSPTEVAELYNSGAPIDPTTASFSEHLISNYRCGDVDTFPTITDTAGSNNLAMTNMTADDFVTDVP